MNFPAELKYTRTHEWVKKTGDTAVVGISDFAQDELGDLVFKEELPAAKEAVMKMGPVDATTVTEKLRELKFSDITCRRVGKMFEKQAQAKK